MFDHFIFCVLCFPVWWRQACIDCIVYDTFKYVQLISTLLAGNMAALYESIYLSCVSSDVWGFQCFKVRSLLAGSCRASSNGCRRMQSFVWSLAASLYAFMNPLVLTRIVMAAFLQWRCFSAQPARSCCRGIFWKTRWATIHLQMLSRSTRSPRMFDRSWPDPLNFIDFEIYGLHCVNCRYVISLFA